MSDNSFAVLLTQAEDRIQDLETYLEDIANLTAETSDENDNVHTIEKVHALAKKARQG